MLVIFLREFYSANIVVFVINSLFFITELLVLGI